MTSAVVAGALAVAALNLLAGGLGGWHWWQAEPEARRLVSAFWGSLRIAQLSSVVFALAVGGLAAGGSYAGDHLFYLYALLPLAVAFVAEQLRVASAQTVLDQQGLADAAAVGMLAEEQQAAIVARIVRREIGVMTLSALVVVFLALRAAGTAHGF
jgi:ABC-type spermidine/putrescine transport system permease subunit II